MSSSLPVHQSLNVWVNWNGRMSRNVEANPLSTTNFSFYLCYGVNFYVTYCSVVCFVFFSCFFFLFSIQFVCAWHGSLYFSIGLFWWRQSNAPLHNFRFDKTENCALRQRTNKRRKRRKEICWFQSCVDMELICVNCFFFLDENEFNLLDTTLIKSNAFVFFCLSLSVLNDFYYFYVISNLFERLSRLGTVFCKFNWTPNTLPHYIYIHCNHFSFRA